MGPFAMSSRLQTFGLVRAIDEENRRVTVVVSTGDIARDEAIIEQDGWDLRHYERNPVVLWCHDDRELPIAKTIESTVGENELTQVHEFATHPRAEDVWQLVKGGFVNATSVRWLPGETAIRDVMVAGKKKQVFVFTKGHQLLESSYVPVPADPGCLVVRADGGALNIRDFAPQEAAPAAEPASTPSLAERLLRGFMRPRLEVGNV